MARLGVAAAAGALALLAAPWLMAGIERDLGSPLTAVGRRLLWAEGSFDAAALSAVAGLPGIDAVAPLRVENLGTIVPQSGRRIPRSLTRWGTVPGFQRVAGLDLAAGRFLVDSDLAGRTLVAVVTAEAAELLFPGRDPIGREIEAGGAVFTVVGVVRSPRLSGLLGQWIAGERVTDVPALIVPLSTVLAAQPDPRVTALFVRPAIGGLTTRQAGFLVDELANRMANVLGRWAGDDEPYLVRGGDIEPWARAGRILAWMLWIVAGLGALLFLAAAGRSGWLCGAAIAGRQEAERMALTLGPAAGGLIGGTALAWGAGLVGAAGAVAGAAATGWPIAYALWPLGIVALGAPAAAGAGAWLHGRLAAPRSRRQSVAQQEVSAL